MSGSGSASRASINCGEQASTFSFIVFLFFNINFFLHLSARIPGYGLIRPTLVLVVLLSVSLYLQRHKFRDIYICEPYVRIKWLLIYLCLSLVVVRWPGSALNNLPDFAKGACFFFFVSMILDSEKRIKLFLFIFIGCQLLRVYEPLAMNIMFDYWGDRTYVGDGNFAQRLSGAPSDVINPNELGFVIATVVPFIYYLLWGGGAKAKVLFLLLLPPLLYALILTMSRGALLALAVIAWMVFKESKYKFVLMLVGAGIVFAGWASMNDVQKDRYLSIFQEDRVGSATAEGRIQGMGGELMLGLTSSPIFGNGLGTTMEAKFHEFGGKVQASHILYAELIIEIGLVGMFIFMLYLKSVYLSLRKIRSVFVEAVEKEGMDLRFWDGLTKAMIAVFWMYLVYSINYFGLSQYYWYMFGGLVLAMTRIILKEKYSNAAR